MGLGGISGARYKLSASSDLEWDSRKFLGLCPRNRSLAHLSRVTCLYSGLEHMDAMASDWACMGSAKALRQSGPGWLRSLEFTWLS